MAKEKIQEKGPMDYRQLQEENLSDAQRYVIEQEAAKRRSMYGQNSVFNFDQQSKVYEDSAQKRLDNDYLNKKWYQSDNNDWFGHSMWDNPDELYYGDKEDLIDKRAENQWGIAQLGAGITKMAGIAGSTFIGGTLGLVDGIIETAGSIGDENQSWSQKMAHIFNNTIQNGIHDFNESLETWLPNYETRDQQENSWLQNIGTMNFWANSMLKSAGYAVGSIYSGKALLAGVEALYKFGPLGMRIAGAFFSSFNEATSEANNLYHDFKNTQYEKMASAYGVDVEDFKNYDEFAEDRDDIEERASKAGLVDLITNIPLTAASDFFVFGKIFTKGYSAAEKQLLRSETYNKIKQAAFNPKTGVIGRYTATEAGTKGAVKKSLREAGSEGIEEINQSFLSATAGNLYDIEDPESYYKERQKDDYSVEANNLVNSIVKGFAESYGKLDSWEEFAGGAFTALTGLPTFGKAANSSSDTWIGRDKKIGITGGLLGNIKTTKETDRQAVEEAKGLNSIVDRLNQQKHFYAKAMSYTDKMNRFRAEGNKFEYKNNEDNLDFESFSMFAKHNRLDDLKRIVNQDFESLNDNDLAVIVGSTSQVDSKTGLLHGWKNKLNESPLKTDKNGNPYLTKEDAAFVREELKKKQKEIKQKIDDYESAREFVDKQLPLSSAIKNGDYKNELYWLRWKNMQFSNRIANMALEGKDSFKRLSDFVSLGIQRMQDEIAEIEKINENTVSTTDEEGNKTINYQSKKDKKRAERIDQLKESVEHGKKVVDILNKTIEASRKAGEDNEYVAFALENLQRKHGKFLQNFTSEINKNDYDNYGLSRIDDNTVKDINTLVDDIHKALGLRYSFLERFRNMVSNPQKETEKREEKKQEQAKQKEEVSESVKTENTKTQVKNQSTSEIVEKLRNDNDYRKELRDLLGGEEFSLEERKKVESALQINEALDKAKASLKSLLDQGEISGSKFKLISNILENNARNANSLEEFKSTDSYASLNPFDGMSQKEMAEQLEEAGVDLGDEDAIEAFIQNSNSLIQDTLKGIFNNLSDIDFSADFKKDYKKDGERTFTANEINDKRKEAEEEQTSKDKKQKQKDSLIQNYANMFFQKYINPNSEKEYIDLILNNYKELLNSLYNIVSKNPDKEANVVIESLRENSDEYLIFTNVLQDAFGEQVFVNNFDSVDSLLNDIYATLKNPVIPSFASLLSQKTNPLPEDVSVSGREAFSNETPMAEKQPDEESMKDENSFTSKEKISHTYWRSNTTEVPQVYNRNNLDLRVFLQSTKKYTPEQIDRIMIIHDFLKGENAFYNAFKINEGQKVYFGTDRRLNRQLSGNDEFEDSDIVILMYNEEGDCIGDLTLPEFSLAFGNQNGLDDFRNKFIQEYKKHQDTDNIYISQNFQTTVSQKLVGKIPYSPSGDRRNLNDVFKSKDSVGNTITKDYYLAVFDGENFLTGDESPINPNDIRMPLNKKAGWVYVLYPSGSDLPGNKWSAVPISIERFSANNKDSKRGKNLKDIFSIMSRQDSFDKRKLLIYKRIIQSILYLPEVHLNYKEGVFQFSIKQRGNSNQVVLFEGPINEFNPDEIIEKLYGTPYQVPTKVINNDMSVNKEIGEITHVNLIEGRTIPFNTWFTVNPVIFGEETSAEKIESMRYNPSAKKENSYTVTVTFKSSGTNKYQLKLDDDSVYKDDVLLDKNNMTKNDKITCAKMWAESHDITTGIAETPFGDFDVSKNKMVGQKEQEKTDSFFVDPDTGEKTLISQEENSSTLGFDVGSALDIFGGLSADEVDTSEGFDKNLFQSKSKLPSQKKENNQTSQQTQSTEQKSWQEMLKDSVEGNREVGFSSRLNRWTSDFEKEGVLPLIKYLNHSQQKKLLSSLSNGISVEEAIKGLGLFRLKAANEVLSEQIDMTREVKWLKKVLPQFSDEEHLQIINAVDRATNREYDFWGRFKDGIITVMDNAAKGTVFHEAFHSVSQTLLSSDEKKFMYKEARNKYGDKNELLLEEELAESFRRYVQLEETPVIGSIIKLFRSLKHFVENLIGNEVYLDGLYYRISRGKFANSGKVYSSFKESVNHSLKKEKESAKSNSIRKQLIDAAHRENSDWHNLQESDREYLEQRGLSIEDWSKMHSDLRDAILHCKP